MKNSEVGNCLHKWLLQKPTEKINKQRNLEAKTVSLLNYVAEMKHSHL